MSLSSPKVVDRLKSLTVADVMARVVVTISPADTMGQAARVMRRYQISAAPVIDAAGQLAGILSASDFVKKEAAWSDPHRIEPASDLVADYMTLAVQTVQPSTPLLKAAAMLDAEHIHRLIVMDKAEHVVGVVSTMDVVSTLLGVFDEVSPLRRNHPHAAPPLPHP